MDAKSGQLKIENMSDSTNRKNDKYVWGALDDTIQGEPDNTMELHLKVNANIYIYKMHKKVHHLNQPTTVSSV